MAIIEANELTKTYRVFQKQEGVLGAIRGLYRREYKEVSAVDRISFTIEPGEMVAFLGPNGAGKTTTLQDAFGARFSHQRFARLGATLFALEAVKIRSAAGRWSWARRINSGGALPPPTAFNSTARFTRCPPAAFHQDARRVDRSLSRQGELTRQPVRELSLGERMKMELIAARLLHQPRLLLLDEPTIGLLDVIAQASNPKMLAGV